MHSILEKYKINPYEYLGVDEFADMDTIRQAYKKKAKLYHPDKNGGKTDVEFKLLVLCYKHAKEHYINTPVSDFSKLKEEATRHETLQEIPHARTFHQTNFEDPQTRKELFVDDDIDFEAFEKEVKNLEGRSTVYVAENYYNEKVISKMKTNGKFDIEKFNAFFLKLKKDGKIVDNQLVKVEEIRPYEDGSKYVRVNAYDGMMINSKPDVKGNYKEFRHSKKITDDDVSEFVETDQKSLSKLIKENKKNTGKMSRKKIKEKISENRSNIGIVHALSFSEMSQKLEIEEQMRIRKEQDDQRAYVMANQRIFNHRISF
jgi:curved DNA-binding protein CbpA